ncbi:MAG: 4Fe-4S dicluster domain-containing protein, partial [Lentisphaeria bacterium]|nr:4Fe-4S dicluster domain-containing protein [Lentisphaeria bacterium]
RSREQYEILTQAEIPVIIMEPLRGGALASLSPDATEILRRSDPDSSNAAWAFRYAASLPNVLCVLSGMSLPEHLEDNIKTFSPLKPLSDGERAVLDAALKAHRKHLTVPCTACRYCLPCPVGVEIPKIFEIYNQYKVSGNRRLFNRNYRAIPEESRADACVNCNRCIRHCPQKIQIPDELKKIDAEMNGSKLSALQMHEPRNSV